VKLPRFWAEKCHVSVAATTVIRFVAVQARKRNGESYPSRVHTLTPKSCDAASTSPSPVINPTAEEVKRRIEELKNRPVPVAAPQKLFHYDPDKPLTFMAKTQKEQQPTCEPAEVVKLPENTTK
jgi:hypothetical protein